MSIVDFKKLKSICLKYDITPFEFFTLDGECAVIKCFLNRNAELLMIYVPSKFRFTISKNEVDKMYALEDIDEDSASSDDYTKTDALPDIKTIDENDSQSTRYKNYDISIMVDQNREPLERKLKRQVERLRLPFAKLNCDIAVHHSKLLCMVFDGENTMFSIKGYTEKKRQFLYLINLKDFIDKIEELHDEIGKYQYQFYQILQKASISNLDSISDQIDQYPSILQTINGKYKDFNRSLNEYRELYRQIKEEENDITKTFKQRISQESDRVRKTMMESELQKKIDQNYKSKEDSVSNGLIILEKFQKFHLILDEVSYDNSIMISRVKTNFELLKTVI